MNSRYDGPVTLRPESGDGEPVTAQARYQVTEHPVTGMKDWHGTLTRIDPPHSLQPDSYVMTVPDSGEARIIITNLRMSTRSPEHARFAGNGPAPGY